MPCSKVSIKYYKCDKAGCFCIPTEGKPCICVCENERGDIMKCDDCKCVKSDDCKLKCDDPKCTCIVTKGADCICVCKDEKGNLITCDCSCTDDKGEEFNKTKGSQTSGCCCSKDTEVAKNTDKKCGCCSKKEEKGGNNDDEKKNILSTSPSSTDTKIYRCDKTECVCNPTGGKSCICTCENEHGNIVKCDNCKCEKSNVGQSTCSDSRCTCCKGVDCICVCRDEKGNFKTCDCACQEMMGQGIEKDMVQTSSECCSKKEE